MARSPAFLRVASLSGLIALAAVTGVSVSAADPALRTVSLGGPGGKDTQNPNLPGRCIGGGLGSSPRPGIKDADCLVNYYRDRLNGTEILTTKAVEIDGLMFASEPVNGASCVADLFIMTNADGKGWKVAWTQTDVPLSGSTTYPGYSASSIGRSVDRDTHLFLGARQRCDKMGAEFLESYQLRSTDAGFGTAIGSVRNMSFPGTHAVGDATQLDPKWDASRAFNVRISYREASAPKSTPQPSSQPTPKATPQPSSQPTPKPHLQ